MNRFSRHAPPRRTAICLAVLGIALAGWNQLAFGAPDDLPETMNAPPQRPEDQTMRRDVDKLVTVAAVPTARPTMAMPKPDTDDVMPLEERTCRARLAALGVKFSELPRVDAKGECGIAFPIDVESLGTGVELTPDGVMNCATAETAAELAKETIEPAARRELGANLSGIRQASAYVCRIRVGGTKISEHAKGNALDISAFMLDDGRTIQVQAYGPVDKPERRFMHTVRGAACGPFKTVLGPGTNADHATHFHLDLAERRRGATYCH